MRHQRFLASDIVRKDPPSTTEFAPSSARELTANRDAPPPDSPDRILHTINNQMQVILGHVSHIFVAVSDAQAKTHCAEIEAAVARVTGLTQMLVQGRQDEEPGSEERHM